MAYFKRPLTALCLVALLAGPALAQRFSRDLIGPRELRRFGLKQAWITQVRMNPVTTSIQDVTLHVSNIRFVDVYEVKFGDSRLVYTERDLDAFGEPLGKLRAEQTANLRLRKLKELGFKPELVPRKVPETTLYVLTSGAMLHAIDGETGRTLWARRFGRSDFPSYAPAANEDYVAVVNGITLYVISRLDGRAVWEKKLRATPTAGVAMSNDRIFVPQKRGMMTAYNVTDPNDVPYVYRTAGQVTDRPVVTPESVCWPTTRGYLYVAEPRDQGMKYRFEGSDTDGFISRPSYRIVKEDFGENLAAGKTGKKVEVTQLFLGSLDGYVYSIEGRTGALRWRFTAAEPVRQAPIVVGESVYVVADRAGMYSVDADTGTERWWTNHSSKFLAASGERVYCSNRRDEISVFDTARGGLVGTIPAAGLDLRITNRYTDRIYIGTKTGSIQCLHEQQLHWPLAHLVPESEGKATRKIEQAGVDKPADGQPGDRPDDKPDDGGLFEGIPGIDGGEKKKDPAQPAPEVDDDNPFALP